MKTSVSREDTVLAHCRNKVVLHIGAADYPYHQDRYEKGKWLHAKIEKAAKRCIGLDNRPGAIADLAKRGVGNIYYGDIQTGKYAEQVLKTKYDLIILGEVIEHLDNPGQALGNLKRFNCDVLITTPNIWGIIYIFNHLRRGEASHKDHCVWFSKQTMDTLLEKHGYRVLWFRYGVAFSAPKPITLKGKVLKALYYSRAFDFFVLSRFGFTGDTLLYLVRP